MGTPTLVMDAELGALWDALSQAMVKLDKRDGERSVLLVTIKALALYGAQLSLEGQDASLRIMQYRIYAGHHRLPEEVKTAFAKHLRSLDPVPRPVP
jgi:hypothetical protein